MEMSYISFPLTNTIIGPTLGKVAAWAIDVFKIICNTLLFSSNSKLAARNVFLSSSLQMRHSSVRSEDNFLPTTTSTSVSGAF